MATIDQRTEAILLECYQTAQAQHFEKISAEMLFISLCADAEVQNIINAFQADLESLRQRIQVEINRTATLAPDDEEDGPTPTQAFKRTVSKALLAAAMENKALLTPTDIFIALLAETDTFAVKTLEAAGITKYGVTQYLHGNDFAVRHYGSSFSDSFGVGKGLPLRDFLTLGVVAARPKSPTVFISYAHEDALVLERLLVHLKPLERSGAIAAWSDQQIRAGQKWRAEIESVLEQAVIAILLVSADFLASDFIVENELPPLLLAADSRGAKILPVVVKPCGFLRDPVLRAFQAVNDPLKPLLGLEHIGQEGLYDKIAAIVDDEIRRHTAAK